MKVPTKFNKYNGIGDPTYYLTTFVAIAVDVGDNPPLLQKGILPSEQKESPRKSQ